jgi:hypothetical protein
MNATRRVALLDVLGLVSATLFVILSSQASWGQSMKGFGGSACPAHWKAHVCDRGTFVCVDPDVDMNYDIAAPLTKVGCNPDSYGKDIPAAFVRGDPFLYGFANLGASLPSTGGSGRHGFWMRALMLDSSMVHGGDVDGALRRLGLPIRYSESVDPIISRGESLGSSSRTAGAELRMSSPELGRMNTEGEPACPSPSLGHACSSMILLCVSPEIERRYDLSDSETFRTAHCDATPLGKDVNVGAIAGDPYKAGYYFGFWVLPLKYVKVLKLDGSKMIAGDIDVTLRKLDLQIPAEWEKKFDQGVRDGATDITEQVHAAEEKSKQMAK